MKRAAFIIAILVIAVLVAIGAAYLSERSATQGQTQEGAAATATDTAQVLGTLQPKQATSSVPTAPAIPKPTTEQAKALKSLSAPSSESPAPAASDPATKSILESLQ